MKVTTPAALTFLNSLRPTGDVALLTANLYTISLTVGPYAGSVLTYTDIEFPVLWNSYTYLANSLMLSGGKYKCSMGASVDKQTIKISAPPTVTIGGVPFIQALQQGLFDGAYLLREKAIFSATSPLPLVPIGTVIMFKGRVSEITKMGRGGAEMSVSSDLVLLDIDYPRNLYQPYCNHVFCDSGCGLSKGAYSTLGTVASGSTQSVLNWTGAIALHQLGTVTFTSGANEGFEATIKNVVAGTSLTLAYPLPNAPSIGDTFVAAQGCDHTQSTCSSTYGNSSNYRGYPYVPPPQVISGPMGSTYTSGGK